MHALPGLSCVPHFNPPSPWGEGRYRPLRFRQRPDFNPPSPWGEGQQAQVYQNQELEISIHPPRGGRDLTASMPTVMILYFNPPSPWGEGLYVPVPYVLTLSFQSTLPVGGGTPRALPMGWSM